jgi:DNA-binding Lrp family transcriptional regulator
MNAPAEKPGLGALDPLDRRIVVATQAGLPLTSRPYLRVAEQVGSTEAEVLARVRRMLAERVIRRIAAVPNHYALGYRANGMSVWNLPDDRVGELGRRVGALAFVTHCYRRPRHLPLWPYNLFAMVHGKSRDEVEEKVREIADLLGTDDRGHDVLYSTKVLKKTGLRIAVETEKPSCSV